MLGEVVVGACAVLAIAFVLEPLVRPREDLKPFDRNRPGTLFHHGLDDDGSSADGDERRLSPGEKRCYSCGALVDEEFRYCGECVAVAV